MPDIVACPQCRKALTVPDHLLGSQVQCPGCGTVFTAGADANPPPPPPALEPARFEDEPRRRSDYEDEPRRGRDDEDEPRRRSDYEDRRDRPRRRGDRLDEM